VRTKTIVAPDAELMDRAIGDYTENHAQRDPDEIHVACDEFRLIAVLVWRSASRAALSPGGRRR
jgi:hypothetical protein